MAELKTDTPPSNPDLGDTVFTLTAREAHLICKRLEYDASWDKAGEGYYSLKRQLRELGYDTRVK